MVKIHSDTHRMSLNTFIQNSQVHILTTRRASCPFMASGVLPAWSGFEVHQVTFFFFLHNPADTHTNANKMIIELLECSTGSFQQFSCTKQQSGLILVVKCPKLIVSVYKCNNTLFKSYTLVLSADRNSTYMFTALV